MICIFFSPFANSITCFVPDGFLTSIYVFIAGSIAFINCVVSGSSIKRAGINSAPNSFPYEILGITSTLTS